IQREIGARLPGILGIQCRERAGLYIFRVPESLLVECRQSQAPRLQRTYARFRSIDPAGQWRLQAQADQGAGKFQKFKTPGKESLRGGVVLADQFVESHLERVVSSNQP